MTLPRRLRRQILQRAAGVDVDLTRERDVAEDCDQLARTYGWHINRLSDARKVRAAIDFPDTYLQHRGRGLRLWFEVKRADDKLTRGQHAFLVRELDAGGLACCGTDAELKIIFDQAVRVPGFGVARRCREIVDVWALKGYRKERKDGTPFRRRPK